MNSITLTRLIAACLALTVSAASAQQAQSPEAIALGRMRDAMKKLTQRIAEADAATATAQAAQYAAEAKVKDLETKVTDYTKQLKDTTLKAKADREAGEKVVEDLEAKLKAKQKEVTLLTESLTKWKEGFEKARDVANAKEGERASAADKSIVLQRQVADHERKNREMYKLGVEILDRYKKFGLGTALFAREPFVGSMRVKFQNYVQDYGDKLASQQIKPGQSKEVGSSLPEKTGQASKP